VGLGNPGSEYRNTPHNLGFDVIDGLQIKWSAGTFSNKFQGLSAEGQFASRKVFLLKPQTYMNLSGRSVRELVQFYKLDPASDLLVVTDDLDLPVGRLRIRPSGSAGGHNGLKSIIQELGTEQFPRLRLGVGRDPAKTSKNFLLSKASLLLQLAFDQQRQTAMEAVETVLREGFPKAMERFNKKEVES
jgi:peptidyl-tRNA hydrolase, PTH1 family